VVAEQAVMLQQELLAQQLLAVGEEAEVMTHQIMFLVAAQAAPA
jgi:hypothetical protein